MPRRILSPLVDSAMNASYDVRRYDFGCYDKHLCLKPPMVMILAAIFLCRDLVLPLVAGVLSLKSRAGNLMELYAGLGQPHWAFLVLPAFLVLVALGNRRPGAHRLFKAIWHKGWYLLILSAASQAAVALWSILAWDFHLREVGLPAVLFAMLMAILAYLCFSRRVRDCFRDFPVADETPPRRGLRARPQ